MHINVSSNSLKKKKNINLMASNENKVYAEAFFIQQASTQK
jgi:hypothetical protein